jgi:hypothetical protein
MRSVSGLYGLAAKMGGGERWQQATKQIPSNKSDRKWLSFKIQLTPNMKQNTQARSGVCA